MTQTLFFRMALRKFSEITKNKPIFSQCNIFYNYEYFFFKFSFWSLFNHHQKSLSNQEQYTLCYSSSCFLVLLCTHYGPLQGFGTYFRILKVVGVLRPIFPDYVISMTMEKCTKVANCSNLRWQKCKIAWFFNQKEILIFQLLLMYISKFLQVLIFHKVSCSFLYY